MTVAASAAAPAAASELNRRQDLGLGFLPQDPLQAAAAGVLAYIAIVLVLRR